MHKSVLICAVMLVTSAIASGDTLVVQSNGAGDFPTIQAAMAASADGDTIELAGCYFRGDGNRDIDFLGKAVTVRSRSGNPGACVILCEGSRWESHRGFLFRSGEGPASRLECVTIKGGSSRVGGGVICENGSSPTISNCRFRGCEGSSELPGGGHGGGLACERGSSPIVRDCVFQDNSGYHGGGVLCSWDSQVTFIRCVFLDNTAALGAGICSKGGGLTLEGCTFSGNVAVQDGSAAAVSGGYLTVEGCTIRGKGAAWHRGSLSLSTVSPATIDNTMIVFDPSGAALYCGNSFPVLSCCNLYGNAYGDWIEPIAEQLGLRGNISEDPLFCSMRPHKDRDWSIQSDSPCAPLQSGCGLIGAWSVDCGPSPVHESSWGRIKAKFLERRGAGAASRR